MPASPDPSLQLLGVDFTSAPGRRKPITVASGRWQRGVLQVQALRPLTDFGAFEALLQDPGPWLGAFDFPFGLPRVFVESAALGTTLAGVVTEVQRRASTRKAWRALIDGWTAGRPAGARLPHRRTDLAMDGTRSTSPLQTRYVPVGLMFYEGLPRLLRAGLTLPGQHAGDPSRVALEAYPGWLAHQLLGRCPYKNGDSPAHRQARDALLQALRDGRSPLARPVHWPCELDAPLRDDAAGDHLDALLALVQAAWASRRPGWGLPPDVDPLEGWIVSAGMPVEEARAVPGSSCGRAAAGG